MSSSLIGVRGERWSLAAAIDALTAAARQAGHPGLIWVAGLLYPAVSLGLNLGWDSPLTHSLSLESFSPGGRPAEMEGRFLELRRPLHEASKSALLYIFFLPALGLLALPLMRLVGGLVRVSLPYAWQRASGLRKTPSLRSLWHAGAGLTLSVYGVWSQLNVITYAALCAILWPMTAVVDYMGTTESGFNTVLVSGLVIGPLVFVLAPYILALSVLQQLALHSLAHNRRGIGSALIHGWRIMRNDFWATSRAVLVDLLIVIATATIWLFLKGPLEILPAGDTLVQVTRYTLIGFAGVARAGYWARAYRALGGLSPDDGVPGL